MGKACDGPLLSRPLQLLIGVWGERFFFLYFTDVRWHFSNNGTWSIATLNAWVVWESRVQTPSSMHRTPVGYGAVLTLWHNYISTYSVKRFHVCRKKSSSDWWGFIGILLVQFAWVHPTARKRQSETTPTSAHPGKTRLRVCEGSSYKTLIGYTRILLACVTAVD